MKTIEITPDEYARLLRSSALLDYVLANVTYIEDGRNSGKTEEHYWGTDDESRTDDLGDAMSLREYLESRVDGKPVVSSDPVAKARAEDCGPDGDDYEDRTLSAREVA